MKINIWKNTHMWLIFLFFFFLLKRISRILNLGFASMVPKCNYSFLQLGYKHSRWQLKCALFHWFKLWEFTIFHFLPLWTKCICLLNELAPFMFTNIIFFLFWLPLSCHFSYSWLNKHNIMTTTNIFSCLNREILKEK